MGFAPRGGAHPPWPAHSPPIGGLVPHGGREEDGTPLGLYKEGYTPLFPTHNILSLLLLPRADSPCLECAPGLEFSTIAGRRSVGVRIRIRLSSAARLVRGPEGTSIVPYVYNLFEALHLWCYFIAGGQSGVSIAGGLQHVREVVVLSLRQPRSQECFPLSIFKAMNSDSLRYFTSP